MQLYVGDIEKAVDNKARSSRDGRKQHTGEQRGGSYAFRIQIGYEKDGSPMYKYFKDRKAYQEYVSRKGKPSKKKGSSLKEKTEKEQKEAKKKTKSKPSSTSGSLFVPRKKGKSKNKRHKKSKLTKDTVKKSLDLKHFIVL